MLYSAKVDDIAKPVVSSSSSDTPAAPKVKRVQSDKQIAALAKAQETRKANRAAAKAAGVVPEKKVRPPIGKKQEPTPTDPEATPSESASHVATLVEEPAPAEKKVEEEFVTPAPPAKEDKKGKRKAVVLEEGDINPPAWFKTFIRNTRKEEAKASKGAKVPAKQVQAEADKFTMEQWQDHYTRDRVNQQSENHLKKMHQMYNQVRNYSQTILI